MKRVVLLGAALAIAASCTAGGTPLASPSPSTSTASGSPASTARPASTEPSLVLQATSGEQAARWELVLAVPFGAGDAQLAYEAASESAPNEPASFTVVSDGSFWIVDAGKARVAHFGADGRFLGAVPTAGRPAEDVSFSGSIMYVLISGQTGRISRIGPKGARSITVRSGGRALRLSNQLYPAGGDGLVVEASGYADSQTGSEGPAGYVRVDTVGSGDATLLPGLPIGRKTAVRVERRRDDQLDLVYLRDGLSIVQPVHFGLLTPGGSKPRRIAGEFAPTEFAPFDGDIAMYVMVSPSRPGDQQRYGGSRWLLRMGRSPVLWERLPDPGVPDESQRRHLAIGPDGRLYLMVLTTNGAQIYRRP